MKHVSMVLERAKELVTCGVLEGHVSDGPVGERVEREAGAMSWGVGDGDGAGVDIVRE